EYLPGFYSIIESKYKGDIDKYVDEMYKKSIFTNSSSLDKYLKKPNLSLKKDLLYIFGVDIYDKMIDLKKQTTDMGSEIRKTNKLYQEGLREKEKGMLKYPDANFTMRLTYGKVTGANPRDGLIYKSQTTLKGVIEKEDSTNYEFNVSPKLKNLYFHKDFGKYGENGNLYTCFLTSTDITGGNSGSPVLNSKGELTGLAFDGNFESLAGDIIYESEKNRSVNVDIRYVLFVIDKFAGAKHILNELTIK
ncbi:MAG: peptidase, partial [Bacteroidetes bacterium]|nr:peptidase [Bacteroidota bacterium]